MFNPDNPPPQSAYERTIAAIRNKLSKTKLDVLRFQFSQPGRAVTSQNIRDFLGYKGIATSNRIYGGIGKQFADKLPMATDPKSTKRPEYWKALSTGDGSGDHFVWIMRPELAGALIETGIVNANADGLPSVPDIDIHPGKISAIEGRKKLVMHLIRERNSALIKAKKKAAKSHACEVCGFDSMATYGIDYCEVHHLLPLGQLEESVETTLDQLAIICANCHRVVHLDNPPKPLDQLRERLATRGG